MEKEISNIIEMLSSVISNGLAENGLCVILHCQYSFCYLIHCKSKFSISCEPASFAKVKGVLPLLSFISRSARYSKSNCTSSMFLLAMASIIGYTL